MMRENKKEISEKYLRSKTFTFFFFISWCKSKHLGVEKAVEMMDGFRVAVRENGKQMKEGGRWVRNMLLFYLRFSVYR